MICGSYAIYVKNGIIFNVLELTEILSKVTANGFVTHVLFESQNKCTGKSLSEALLFAEHGEKMLCTKSVLNIRNKFCTQHVLPRFELGIFMYWTCNSMNNLSSYYGLVNAKIKASDKDLPVRKPNFEDELFMYLILYLVQLLKAKRLPNSCHFCQTFKNALTLI
jgi:hypothetical protein